MNANRERPREFRRGHGGQVGFSLGRRDGDIDSQTTSSKEREYEDRSRASTLLRKRKEKKSLFTARGGQETEEER